MQIYEMEIWTLDPNWVGQNDVQRMGSVWETYGNESEETDFTSVSPSIRKLYGISEDKDVNVKYYDYQTFNIF